ncbi:MAG: TetR/AcrR family transcriptional regulator [Gemmatimonadota bacterium]
MGSKERRERERADTRQRILDAARDMFVERGYEATTMRAIAARVEYTPTAIYHHFRNKEALITELCTLDFRSLAQRFIRIEKVPDPIERIGRLGEAYVEFAIAHPNHYQLMFMTPRPPASQDLVDAMKGDPSEDAYALLRETCVDAIESGLLRPELTDPDELAQILWSALHGLVSLRIIKTHDAWLEWGDVRRTAGRVREILIRGMRRDPS